MIFRKLIDKYYDLKFPEIVPDTPQIPLDVLRAKLAREKAERPPMPPITNGVMSVAIQRTEEYVLVYIELSEVTKHILSDARALNTPVDEFYLDMSDEIREYSRSIDDLDDRFVSKREKEDEKRLRTEQFTAPQYITFDNMLANPYRRYVRTPQEALEYIEKLKTKILPKIKSIIEGHSSPKTESFEL